MKEPVMPQLLPNVHIQFFILISEAYIIVKGRCSETFTIYYVL
jgi:hypothetical protein